MVTILKMDKERIYFKSDKVLYEPCIDVWLPEMPSYPEGYRIRVYGHLRREIDGGDLYLSDLRTIDPTDMIIYNAFIDFLELQKENYTTRALLQTALSGLIVSIEIKKQKMKELGKSVYDLKDNMEDIQRTLELSKLMKDGNTTVH